MPYDTSPLFRALLDAGIPCQPSEPLRDCTTFRIGGAAALLARPRTEEQLLRALSLWRTDGDACPLFILGRGSNVLFPDAGFPGLVISTRALHDVTILPKEDGAVQLAASCGASVAGLSRRCAEATQALSGLEFACGIPGTVGGAVFMNAGAHGSDMAEVVMESRYIDTTSGYIGTLSRTEHRFAYRHSAYQSHPTWVILSATLALSTAESNEVRSAVQQHIHVRQRSQPLEYPSAGSVFRRPTEPGMFAGKLIEDCGLKGFRIGSAEVSEKHAGFIVNRGGATADDVRQLIEYVRKTVYRAFGVELSCELCIVREDGSVEGGTDKHEP